MKKILLFMVATLLVLGMVSCDQEVKTKTYKVAYNANGAVGNVPATIEVEEGGNTTVPSCGSLSMKGYDFVGWNTKKDGSGKAYKESQSVKVDSDTTLYAQWCIHSYSISYDLDGGSYQEGRSNPNRYTIETETFTLNNPKKDGYEFLGWKTSECEEPNKNVSINKGTIGDLLFIAVWRPLKSYSISYDVNGGEGSIGTVLKLEGESVEIATASEVSRNGYGFVRWNTESDGTGKNYDPGDLYEEDADLQLYAKWSIVKYSIEYNLNDGKLATGKSNPDEYTVETADIVLENPTKHGYEFVGWRYKDDSDALASTNFSIKRGTTGNLSIVAVWKALGTYMVSYDANGGTGTIETQYKYKGESLTISSGEGLERNGYTFLCWNTEKDGTGMDYKPNYAYSAGSDLRLYAQWNPVKYSIKYDLDGGAFPEGSVITEYTIETDTFTLPIPMRAEYEFIGWKAKVSDEAKKTVSIEKGSTGNLSFTAFWRKLNRYTVSYDANGGFGSIESQSKLEGVSISISDAVGITRTGYTFVCWNTKSDGTGEVYNPNDEYTNDADLVLYAKWSVVKYSITYDLAGGTLPEGKGNPSDYTIETETFTLVNPEKEGYIFEGWKESCSMDGAAAENVSITKGATGNKSFIATWRLPKKYTVTFNANVATGGTPPDSLTVYEGGSFTVPSCDSLYRDDYVFEEWNTRTDGSGSRYSISEKFEVHEDTTLYAIWKESPLEYTYLSESDSYSVKCKDKSVSSIVIPSMYKGKPVSEIGDDAFYSYYFVLSIAIPSNVTNIGNRAFYGCGSMTSITIPEGVTSIGDQAFYGCGSLTSIKIPESVTRIGKSAFYSCSGRLKSIEVEAGNCAYYSEGNCLIERDTKCLILGCRNSMIPEGVTSIGSGAFHGCNGLTSITIPEGVTSIGGSAFSSCSRLTSVTISEGVTSIGSGAFHGCNGLTSITIPSSVTSIGGSAFYNCKALTSITIPSSVTSIESSAFSGCSGLTSVTIPEDVTSIGSYAFSGCSGLTSITIPEGVVSIGSSAFSGCNKIKTVVLNDYVCKNYTMKGLFPDSYRAIESVVIPEGATGIGDQAFDGCRGLTSITIPESVTTIGTSAFSSCDGIKTVVLNDYVCKNYTMKGLFPDSYRAIESVVIPEGATCIGDQAFDGCSGIASITIPESVTSIGDSAFSGCTGIKTVVLNGHVCNRYTLKGLFPNSYYIESVVITEGVTGIEAQAFYGCNRLKDVSIPEGVTIIGDSAFKNCSGLTSITIPDSVTSIWENAFSGCVGIKSIVLNDYVCKNHTLRRLFPDSYRTIESVVIPEGVTSIGAGAFNGCIGLTSVTIPEGVTSIGDSAFSDCSGLTSITIADSVISIGEAAFCNCKGLRCITIPESVTSVGGYGLFIGCENLEVVFADGMESIPEWVLHGASGVVSVSIPSGVASIGSLAFHGCSGLTSITIPESVTSIDSYAFGGCRGLTSVTIPKNVTYIGEKAFYDCGEGGIEVVFADGMESIPEQALSWASVTSVSIPSGITSIGASAFELCSGLTSITIPESVTNIGSSAFYGCRRLTSITIPEGVTSIGDRTFSGCSGLTSITIPEGITSIGDSAFSGCSGLTSITIPSSVTSIGGSAFYNCKALTSITIPSSVTSIGSSAFYNCSGLTSITISESVISIGSDVFRNCNKIKSVVLNDYVCKNYTLKNLFPDSYRAIESVVILEGVTGIGSYAFHGCSGLTSITIPESVTSIGDWAFSGCIGLTSVTIPEGVTNIGDRTFDGCSGLASITIPKSVTSIGDYAFFQCSGLTSITISEGVTSIGYSAFYGCKGLTSMTIPESVTSIGVCAFSVCSNLKNISYSGSKMQWESITKGSLWNDGTGDYTIHCTDGDIAKN